MNLISRVGHPHWYKNMQFVLQGMYNPTIYNIREVCFIRTDLSLQNLSYKLLIWLSNGKLDMGSLNSIKKKKEKKIHTDRILQLYGK